MDNNDAESREGRLMWGWSFEIEAKKAGLWVDLIPIECPHCRRKAEWPKRLRLPNCGDCLWRGFGGVQMRKLKPEGPEPEPKPKPPSTRQMLGELATQMAEIAERLRRLEGEEPPD